MIELSYFQKFKIFLILLKLYGNPLFAPQNALYSRKVTLFFNCEMKSFHWKIYRGTTNARVLAPLDRSRGTTFQHLASDIDSNTTTNTTYLLLFLYPTDRPPISNNTTSSISCFSSIYLSVYACVCLSAGVAPHVGLGSRVVQ